MGHVDGWPEDGGLADSPESSVPHPSLLRVSTSPVWEYTAKVSPCKTPGKPFESCPSSSPGAQAMNWD